MYDSIILYLLNGKTTETDKRLVVARAWGWRGRPTVTGKGPGFLPGGGGRENVMNSCTTS